MISLVEKRGFFYIFAQLEFKYLIICRNTLVSHHSSCLYPRRPGAGDGSVLTGVTTEVSLIIVR